MNQKIAFLGLGVMGAPMTANLIKNGFSVTAWNRTPNRPGVQIAADAGAKIVATIEEAVTSAEVIFLCVGDVPDVEEVILGDQGVVNYAPKGALVVDFSTIGADAARRIGAELKKHQLRFLDAPISGGDIGAQRGTLTIMVGGEAEDFAQSKPLLEAMGKTIRHCGAVGSGQAVKMCNQVLCSLHMVGLCEAMLLAKQQGIDPSLIVEVCSTGAAGSWALANLGEKVAQSDFEPGFMIKHMLKDLRLVEESLSASELDLPGATMSQKMFQIVQQLGGSEQGTQAMIRAYSESP